MAEASETCRRIGEIGFQETVELRERLLIERYIVKPRHVELRFLQAVRDGPRGKTGVVFLSREPLFLSRGNDLAVNDERRCRIVIEGRDT